MTRHGTRLANVQRVIQSRYDGSLADFARAIERSPAQVWQFINGTRNIGERLARDIELKVGLAVNSLDSPSAAEPPATYRAPVVPIVGTAQLGEDGYWHELQYPTGGGDGFVHYPTRDGNAYAVRVKGDSMRPRIKPGELVVVEPNHPVAPGDEVLVKTRDGRSMVKVLGSRRDGRVELYSVNEDHRPISMDEADIEALHYVGGILKASMELPPG